MLKSLKLRLILNFVNFELEDILESWKLHRNLTYDMLEFVPDEMLKETVGKNMGSIGKQFRHIGDVQLCYIEAIRTGKIDFSKYRRDYSIESSKEKLKQSLKELDNEMSRLLKTKKELQVDWGFMRVSLARHLNFLIQHEILHHGELIVYIRSLGLKFPKSWEDVWGPLNAIH